MALTNAQHDAVMRILYARQQNARRIQEQRESAAYSQIPELADLDAERASLALKKARAVLEGASDGDLDLPAALSRLSDRRKELLKAHGLPEDWLDLPCTGTPDTSAAGNAAASVSWRPWSCTGIPIWRIS